MERACNGNMHHQESPGLTADVSPCKRRSGHTIARFSVRVARLAVTAQLPVQNNVTPRLSRESTVRVGSKPNDGDRSPHAASVAKKLNDEVIFVCNN